jgi:hypothetical protein
LASQWKSDSERLNGTAIGFPNQQRRIVTTDGFATSATMASGANAAATSARF